jgi:hypothetical protein
LLGYANTNVSFRSRKVSVEFPWVKLWTTCTEASELSRKWTQKRPPASRIASSVLDGVLMLKDTCGGSSVTVVKEDMALPTGRGVGTSGWVAWTVTTVTVLGTWRMRLRMADLTETGSWIVGS